MVNWHYDCPFGRCAIIRAYARPNREWEPVGFYYTGCHRFEADENVKDDRLKRRIKK